MSKRMTSVTQLMPCSFRAVEDVKQGTITAYKCTTKIPLWAEHVERTMNNYERTRTTMFYLCFFTLYLEE